MDNKINSISMGGNEYEIEDKTTQEKINLLKEQIDNALESNDLEEITNTLKEVKEYIGERADTLEAKIASISASEGGSEKPYILGFDNYYQYSMTNETSGKSAYIDFKRIYLSDGTTLYDKGIYYGTYNIGYTTKDLVNVLRIECSQSSNNMYVYLYVLDGSKSAHCNVTFNTQYGSFTVGMCYEPSES